MKSFVDKRIAKEINEQKNKISQPGYVTIGTPIQAGRSKMVAPLIFGENVLRLQLPVCSTKQGVITSATRTYTDLMFDNNNEKCESASELVAFIDALESQCANLVYENKEKWFAKDDEEIDNLTLDDFQEMFTSLARLNNRGAHISIRVEIGKGIRGHQSAITPESACIVYNKQGETQTLGLINANKETRIVPLVEFSEISISPSSISLVVDLVECMILDDPITNVKRERRIFWDSPINEDLASVENNENNEIVENDFIENEMVELDDKNVKEDEIIEQIETINTPDFTSFNDELQEVDIQAIISDNQEDECLTDYGEEMTEVKELEIDNSEPISLRKPDEVYKEIYKAAIAKAKRLRQVAMDAYLDAKKIKARFMLDELTNSDEESDDEFFEQSESH